MFNQGKPVPNYAQNYDAHIEVTIPYYRTFHLEVINLVKAFGGEPRLWLDTGCGTGNLVLEAAKSFPQTDFLLTDPSSEMLDAVRAKLGSEDKTRITFLERSSTQDITLPEGDSPDVITAVLCHHYLRDQARADATRRCYQLLSPGGAYITFENIRPLTSSGTEIAKAYWLAFQVASGKTEAEAENHLKRFGVEYFPITVEEHLAQLRGCGFKTVELFWYSYLQAGFFCIK
jgi:tRNA (cmo5U34)-methyltransferase